MLQYYFSLRQFQLIGWSFFIHSTTPYIHLRLDSGIELKFPIAVTVQVFTKNSLTSYSQGARFLKIDLAQLSSQKRFDFRNS